MPKLTLFLFFGIIFQLNCVNTAFDQTEGTTESSTVSDSPSLEPPLLVGAERSKDYLPLLTGKRIGLVVNQTSRVPSQSKTAGLDGAEASSVHLVDTLQRLGLDLKKIFALEHGFRGTADAGAIITDGVDEKSGLPIVTLYGKKKEPTAEDVADIDVIIFDIQDVGARFYTYISSLHYVMQGAAKNGVPVFILDRPNPNGHYVDGPILDPNFRSFVGMHPVPVVHGMTIGEYGRMINGEEWLEEGLRAELTVIPCENYTRSMSYPLPVKPSPNLPNYRSVLLYPSLCFFEGTTVSIGRGTDTQFQIYGHPELSGSYTFTPRPGPGSANPKLNGVTCRGYDLTLLDPATIRAQGRLDLQPLLFAYSQLGEGLFSRPEFFDKLAGGDGLRKAILAGQTEEQIRADWAAGLRAFKSTRRKYLLY